MHNQTCQSTRHSVFRAGNQYLEVAALQQQVLQCTIRTWFKELDSNVQRNCPDVMSINIQIQSTIVNPE